MTELMNKITAVLVLAFISAVLLLTVLKGSDTGIEEGSTDKVSHDKSALSECIGGAMTDNFFGRELWARFNAEINNQLGEGIVNGVYVNGNMLLDTEAAEKKIASNTAREINEFAANYDGAVYLAVIPTSSGVYGDKLPPYLEKNTEVRRINTLYEQLDNTIKKIDACNILKTHSNNYIYYRSDTKWTGYGAYCVYRTVIQKLGFTPSVYDKYTIRHLSSDFRGNLYKRTGWNKLDADIIDAYDYSGGAEVTSCVSIDSDGNEYESSLYDKSLLDSDYTYDIYLGRRTQLMRIETSVKNERKLLVIKDSYADCFVPFLTQHYSEIAVVDIALLDEQLKEYIDLDDYSQTLFLFGIENLGSSRLLDKLND